MKKATITRLLKLFSVLAIASMLFGFSHTNIHAEDETGGDPDYTCSGWYSETYNREYTAWSDYSTTSCGADSDVCQSKYEYQLTYKSWTTPAWSDSSDCSSSDCKLVNTANLTRYRTRSYYHETTIYYASAAEATSAASSAGYGNNVTTSTQNFYNWHGYTAWSLSSYYDLTPASYSSASVIAYYGLTNGTLSSAIYPYITVSAPDNYELIGCVKSTGETYNCDNVNGRGLTSYYARATRINDTTAEVTVYIYSSIWTKSATSTVYTGTLTVTPDSGTASVFSGLPFCNNTINGTTYFKHSSNSTYGSGYMVLSVPVTASTTQLSFYLSSTRATTGQAVTTFTLPLYTTTSEPSRFSSSYQGSDTVQSNVCETRTFSGFSFDHSEQLHHLADYAYNTAFTVPSDYTFMQTLTSASSPRSTSYYFKAVRVSDTDVKLYMFVLRRTNATNSNVYNARILVQPNDMAQYSNAIVVVACNNMDTTYMAHTLDSSSTGYGIYVYNVQVTSSTTSIAVTMQWWNDYSNSTTASFTITNATNYYCNSTRSSSAAMTEYPYTSETTAYNAAVAAGYAYDVTTPYITKWQWAGFSDWSSYSAWSSASCDASSTMDCDAKTQYEKQYSTWTTAVSWGNTSTITDTVMEDFVNNYQLVAYIEADHSDLGNPYIDTGYALASNSSEIEISFNSSSLNNSAFYGAQSSSSPFSFSNWFDGQYGAYFLQSGSASGYQTTYSFNVDANAIYTLSTVTNGDGTGSFTLAPQTGNALTTSFTYTGNTYSGNNIYLFTASNAPGSDYYAYGRIYYFKVIDNGVLVRYMVPCYHIVDGTVGMYDLVNGVFYANAGTGSFNAGSSISFTSADSTNKTLASTSRQVYSTRTYTTTTTRNPVSGANYSSNPAYSCGQIISGTCVSSSACTQADGQTCYYTTSADNSLCDAVGPTGCSVTYQLDNSSGSSFDTSGFTNHDLYISATCTGDAGAQASGFYQCENVTMTANGGGILKCYDRAGNATSLNYDITQIDKTSPTCQAIYTPQSAGWINSAVVVSSSCVDHDDNGDITYASGLNVSACQSATVSANETASITCADNAGNITTIPYTVSNIDMTAPDNCTVTYSTAELTTEDVTVSVSCSDLLSGMDTSTCQSVTVSENGSGYISCGDNVGNTTNVSYEVAWIDKSYSSIIFTSLDTNNTVISHYSYDASIPTSGLLYDPTASGLFMPTGSHEINIIPWRNSEAKFKVTAINTSTDDSIATLSWSIYKMKANSQTTYSNYEDGRTLLDNDTITVNGSQYVLAYNDSSDFALGLASQLASSDGVYQLSFTVTSANGRITTRSVYLYYDTTSPTVTGTATIGSSDKYLGVDGAIYSNPNSVTASITASEATGQSNSGVISTYYASASGLSRRYVAVSGSSTYIGAVSLNAGEVDPYANSISITYDRQTVVSSFSNTLAAGAVVYYDAVGNHTTIYTLPSSIDWSAPTLEIYSVYAVTYNADGTMKLSSSPTLVASVTDSQSGPGASTSEVSSSTHVVDADHAGLEYCVVSYDSGTTRVLSTASPDGTDGVNTACSDAATYSSPAYTISGWTKVTTDTIIDTADTPLFNMSTGEVITGLAANTNYHSNLIFTINTGNRLYQIYFKVSDRANNVAYSSLDFQSVVDTTRLYDFSYAKGLYTKLANSNSSLTTAQLENLYFTRYLDPTSSTASTETTMKVIYNTIVKSYNTDKASNSSAVLSDSIHKVLVSLGISS